MLLAAVPPPGGGKEEHRQDAEDQTDVCGEGLHPAKYCSERKTAVARGPVVVFAIALAKLVGVPKFSEPGRQYKSSDLLHDSWECLPSTVSNEG